MFGASTPKRQWAYSNSSSIKKLDVGWKRMVAKVPTAEKYQDRSGKVRYKGTKHLRHTETLVSTV